MIADILIKNGRICDGSGDPSYQGSIAISEGRIVAVGQVEVAAHAIYDAAGKVVAPGFIDPHTHFDAQLLWDGRAEPSIEHGVTTIVPGNCSLSLAPLKAAHRDYLVKSFLQIEEMPESAFEAGVVWSWESFPQYIDTVKQKLGINVAPLVGHSLIRLWVMGMDARNREATDAEIGAMQDLLSECLDSGAVGLSISWVDVDCEYRPVPSRFAQSKEIFALCEVLGKRGRVLQVVPEFWDIELLCARIDTLAALSIATGVTTTFSPLFHSNSTPDLVERALQRIQLHAGRGARVVPQMQTRPIDYTFDLTAPGTVFIGMQQWWATLSLPHAEKLNALRNGEVRAALLAEIALKIMPISLSFEFDDFIVTRVAQSENVALVGKTLRELGAMRGCGAVEAMLDLAIAEDLQTCFTMVAGGHSEATQIGKYLAHPLIEIGAADGGAHIQRFSTYGDTSYLFSHFVRGSKAMSVEAAVRKITFEIAKTWGIAERGALKPGYAADIVIFDPNAIDRGPEIAVEDLPAPGYRYIRRSLGVDTVFINGKIAYSDGRYINQQAGQMVCAPLGENGVRRNPQ